MNNTSLTPVLSDYELLDSGDFEKLERFGRYVTRRPEPQAIWHRSLTEEEWRRRADAAFLRDARSDERGEWRLKPQTPDRWVVAYDYEGMHLRMRMGLTSFKHVGIFPEQAANWNFIYDRCRALAEGGRRPRLLNLFAYTGGATLAACAAGAEATHVDSVRQVVTWARENMESSGLDGVRWIVEDALKFVRREVRRGSRYDAIVLDVMLPKVDGFEVARRLRCAHVSTPILMLTAREEIPDKIAGLDHGADDYMTKPFDIGELLARVRALTRRQGEVIGEQLAAGDLVLDTPTRSLRCGEKSVRLGFKEFDVLRLLLAAPRAVIPKEDIISKVWGLESEAEDNNVEVYISFLRKKLAYLGSRVSIGTVRKVGYHLEVPGV